MSRDSKNDRITAVGVCLFPRVNTSKIDSLLILVAADLPAKRIGVNLTEIV